MATVLHTAESEARYFGPAAATLGDSDELIDLLADDPQWADWSQDQLEKSGQQAALVIHPFWDAAFGMRHFSPARRFVPTAARRAPP